MVYCLAYHKRRLVNYSVYKMQYQDLFLAWESFLTLHRSFMNCTGCRFLCVLIIRVLLFTLKCIYGLAPTYLSDLISIKSNSSYSLRLLVSSYWTFPKERSLQQWEPAHFQHLPVELCQATSHVSVCFEERGI